MQLWQQQYYSKLNYGQFHVGVYAQQQKTFIKEAIWMFLLDYIRYWSINSLQDINLNIRKSTL